jgi:hypothetical protein
MGLGLSVTGGVQVAAAAQGVQITKTDGALRIEIRGEPFAEYRYEGSSRPFLYPVYGPGGLPMTRNWPMKEAEGEAKDHPHHRSLWWAHGDVNGVDFWSEGRNAGKTVHDRFLEIRSGEREGVIRCANKLVDREGKVIATDERTMRIHHTGEERILDFDITVHASEGALTFGDTKEGTMAIRLASTMRLRGVSGPGKGMIVNSEGVTGKEAWGKRAKWVDYFGPVQGETVGVAIFDHPENPRHPTWWHVRDYGLFAANPFGVHDFERKPAGTGDLTVPAGESITWRYRFLFHRGDAAGAAVADRYAAYVSKRALPEGYTLLFRESFEGESAMEKFVFSDPGAWRYSAEGGQGALELHRQSKYRPRVRSPYNIALIADRQFGDFILEADLVQTGREYGHRDMCLFFGFKDPANFYYAHIATKADPHAHNVFLVNDEPRVAIAEKTTAGVNWGLDVWHKVRLERTLEDGMIKVFFDDMSEPIMVAEDKHFDYGMIGFGSFDDTGKVANIRIWGPGFAPEKEGLFR